MTSGAATIADTTSADWSLGVRQEDSSFGAPGTDITVREVPWHHLAAVALREALAGELLLRQGELPGVPGGPAAPGAGTFGASAATVAYSAVAFTGEGLPVGHTALRWIGDDVGLAGLYVVPGHRDSGVAATLLAAAAQAAAIRLLAGRARADGIRADGIRADGIRADGAAAGLPRSAAVPLAAAGVPVAAGQV